MGEVSVAFVVKLAAKLLPYTIKAASKIKGALDERRVQKDLEDSLKDAQRAFRACVPKGMAIPPEILNSFFDSDVFESQYQKLLEGHEAALNPLEEAFYEAGYTPESVPGFEPRLAIAQFFREFVQSVGRKESFTDMNTLRLLYDGSKRRYCEQVVKAYENLSFAGVPGAYDQSQVKLEDIFITLQASRRIPDVDVLMEERERPEPIEQIEQRRPPRDVRIRDTVEVLSVTEALKDSEKMVVLGAPGSGKTTFMRYLALTFAQKLSHERLTLDEDKLPILITIQDIAEDLSSGKTIAEVLSKHIRSELQLDLPDEYFLLYLEAGRCIVLFDGLDEVADIKQRGEVAGAVSLFANLYRGNRYIITSRIAGYREIEGLPQGDFTHFTIRDFDDDQIRDFARRWYMARYPSEADRRTDDLIQAIERNPKVKQLAANPLMLTIVAVVHRSSAELPSERIKLYDLCTEALLYSWQREHGRASLTDVHGDLIRDTEVRRRLEQLAYWMHSQSPAESRAQMHVPYARLKSVMTEQLIDRKGLDPVDAEDEVKSFLEYIRKTTGVLLERGTQLYAFVHLTFQEYFAACDIYRRCRGDAGKVWEDI